MSTAIARSSSYFPGIGVSITIAMAATFLSLRYGAPAMLMGLLLGLAFNFLMDSPKVLPGIELAANGLLRLGVALLGLRMTFADVMTLGWVPILVVCSAVLLTLGFGIVVARLMGLSARLGTLTGGAVAICGASAAMAISSVLPADDDQRKETLFTVIGVTTLSTTAMVFYPLVSHFFGLSDTETGLFLGATIHDVAQVVGAGYSVSGEVGDLSTFVKLLRVAMLVPVVILIGLVARSRLSQRVDDAQSVPPIPWFLVLFVALFIANSFSLFPATVVDVAASGASWLLLTAIAALGVRTSLKEIVGVGIRPVVLMAAETLFIAGFILAFILIYKP